MEDSKTKTPANELEVTQMVWINSGSGIDLESVIVMC